MARVTAQSRPTSQNPNRSEVVRLRSASAIVDPTTQEQDYLTAVEKFIGFWNQCDLSAAPFAHPDDLPILQSRRARHADLVPKDFDSFITSERFGDFKDARLHLSLLPIPYAGDLRRADIVLLLLNPGFSYMNYHAETHLPAFRNRLEQNLRQTLDGIEFPFMSLDPEFCWYGGFIYWESKLRDVLRIIADEKFNGRYLDVLRDLSHRLAYVQLVPYHSPSFKCGGLIKRLPSSNAARRFVHDAFSRSVAVEEKQTVIVTRRERDWALSEHSNVITYRGSLTRGVPLGPKTPGGRAILKRYGIQPK